MTQQQKHNNNEIVYAIHAFIAENEDELNFNVGEPIVVLERDEKYMDGWWQGRNVKGHTGLFPMNYISTEKPINTLSNNNNDHNNNTLHPSPSTTSTNISRDDIRTEEWNTAQVASWLESVGLGSVTQNFIEQEITGDILLELTMDSLKELGITIYGKRFKIIQAINHELRPSPPKRTSRCPPPSPIDSDNSQRNSLTPNIKNNSNTNSDSNNNNGEHHRPVSPQSLRTSSSISRSNTFHSMSSKKSTSSTGTFRSMTTNTTTATPNNYHEEPVPLLPSSSSIPKKATTASLYSNSSPAKPFDGTYSSVPSSTTTGGGNSSHWMSDSNISTSSLGSSYGGIPDQPLDVNATRKLSVASIDQQQQDASQAPEHEGWLHKQGDKYKTWNKRWFVLKGPNLFYFKSPKDVRMKGIINLRGYRIVVDETIHSGKYSFKAQHDRERTFYFYTDTEESMRKWIQALIKTTIARDISTPVMSSNPVATVSLDVARRMRPRPPSMLMFNKQHQPVPLQQLQEQMSMLHEEEDEQDYQRNEVDNTMVSSSIADGSSDYYEGGRRPDYYIDWINANLSPGEPVEELSTAFRDGERLIDLLENLSQKQVRRPPPPTEDDLNNEMHMLDTIVAAFKFMGREGVEVDGRFTIKDVFSGEEDKIMNMIDAIKTWSATI
ncbi:hypothetical protein INT45_012265 [Circinella minor]|uniref:Uncharacterized protein n=1 Tax=Circinella minor TaxID=1195481 RepID=A0A8H7S0R9_9FUNG|nr:hypothetical protein INT45_012265 [Circinella minor]